MAKLREEYRDDGEILEERGWLPGWWMWLLYVTIALSIVYVIYLNVTDWSQEKQYLEEVARMEKLSGGGGGAGLSALDENGSNPHRDNAASIAEGKKTFNSICAACHKIDGTGFIGPNLMDARWLHGHTDKEVFAVVMEGVPVDKIKQPQKPPQGGPMPPNSHLGARKILEVLAFLAKENPSLKAK